MTAAELHRLVAELMHDEWDQVPVGFEWTPAVVAEVDRLHGAGDDHALPDPSAHFAAFGLDLLRHAESGAAGDATDVSLIADVLSRWFPDATPALVADMCRRRRAESDAVVAENAVEGYALFGLRLLVRYRARP